MKSINKKEIKTAIPKKWTSVGITALFMQFLMNNKVLANIILDPGLGVSAGVQPYYSPIYTVSKAISVIISGISILLFAITGISIIITKLKAKKDNNIKVGKKTKIIFITSIVLFVLSRIALVIIDMF